MSVTTFNHALMSLVFASATVAARDFRATASTRLHEMGLRSDFIELQLAHVERRRVRAALALVVLLGATCWLDQQGALFPIRGPPIAVLLLVRGRFVRRWFLRRTMAAAVNAANAPRQLRSQWRRAQ
jgi:hypothetical protein